MSVENGQYRHGLRPALGRNPTERGRAATPLELLYDLTFVAAFGVAASQLAHGIETGHAAAAVLSFVIAMTASVWAWTNFTWFASAFDNDDWLSRVLTMVQMAGVLVIAIGLPALFASIEEGRAVDNTLVVAGYIVIRVAVALQWLRAARHDKRYQRLAVTYSIIVAIAQVGWVVLAILRLPPVPALIVTVIVFTVEALAPVISERNGRAQGGVTPWNAHHLAERYGLITIIALGETVLGTLSSATQISAQRGWSADAIVVIGAGVGLSLALWWAYFLVPHAAALSARRTKVTAWAYGHIVLLSAVAATGAGLHVIGFSYNTEHPVAIPTVVIALATPVLIFMLTRFLLQAWLTSSLPGPVAVHVVTLVLPVVAIFLALAGWPMWGCLLVILASPVSLIVSYELGGWRTLNAQLGKVLAPPVADQEE